MDDVIQFAKLMLHRFPAVAELPRFLLGHSMGGAITFLTALRTKAMWSGVVFSGPGEAAAKEVGAVDLQWSTRRGIR